MRSLLIVSCCLAFLPIAAHGGDTDPSVPLSVSKCLDSSRARGWTSLYDGRILVDGGRHKYRIEVEPACPGLNFTLTLGLRGDPIFGKVCGRGDEIVVRDYTCSIQRIELLSNAEYKQALKDRAAERKARKAARN